MTPAAGLVAHPWQGLEGLGAARPAWSRLLAASAADPLCNAPGWVVPHVEAYTAPDAVFGWTFEDAGGEPAGFAALREEPTRGALALRRLTLAADGTQESDYLDLVARRGHEPAVVAALLDALAAVRRGEALLLTCVPDDSACLAALRAELERRGLPRREVPVPCLAAPLPDEFETYLAGLKPRMRSKVRSALRRTAERGARLAWCDRADELEGHLEGLFDLHTARWSEAGETGSFSGERRRDFYRRLMPALLAEGRLRFARLELDGRAAAYQLGALAGGSYYQIQEGYRPELAELRVATALRAGAIRELIVEGVTRYDFMAGDSRHKRDWGGELRPCTSVACALPGLRARLAYGARSLVDRWRAGR